MRIACPDCEGGGELCLSCEGWGQIDVYQADDDTMRLSGNWSVERERANRRRRERKREQQQYDRRRQENAEVRERKALLRQTGVPRYEWHRCLTLDEAVVYCQAYHDQNQEGST